METDELLANVTEVAGSKVLPPCVVYGRLGRGGMGAVYRARHLNLAIDVAVKVLKPALVADDPSFVSRFKREGQSAAAISHQNVIRVFDVAEHAGLHYIIMELVVGETARQRVQRRGALPVDEALQILYESALGLGAAHALGIVHRDVKPDNLLISNTGQLKVADLGLAKPTMGTGGASLMSSAHAVMGTPSYMPPEQWESPQVGPSADVWALGTTAWFLLTGTDAFDSRDGNFPRVMRQILLEPFPDLKAQRAELTDGVLAVLAKATAKDPTQRYADCGELAAAIEGLGIKRVTLRDRADIGEANTLVSPSPKELDRIKQWLREDFATRMQSTPRSAARPPTSGSGATGLAAGELSPGGTMVSPPPIGPLPMEPRGRKVRWVAIAAGVLVLGGSGAAWALLRDPAPPQPDPERREDVRTERPQPENPVPPPVNPQQPPVERTPSMRAQELAALGQLDDAITTLTAVPAAQQDQPQRQQLAGLLDTRATRAADAGRFRSALSDVRDAVTLVPALQPQQVRLRDRAARAAREALVRTAPTEATPVRTGEDVEFRGTLAFDAVRELRLGGEVVALPASGEFVCTLRVTQAQGAPSLQATLVDDHVVDFGAWPLRFESAPAALAFDARIESKTTQGAGGLLFTAAETVDVSGQLPADATLRVNGVVVTPRRGRNDSFSLAVPTAESREVPVQLRASKDGFADVDVDLGTIVRLARDREIDVREPADRARIDAFSTRVEVRTDRWTRSMRVRAGTVEFPLQPVAGTTLPTFAGNVELRPDTKLLVVVATNAAGRDNSKDVRIECVASAAAIAGVTLETPLSTRAVTLGERCYVGATTGVLRIVTTGTEVELTCDGAAVAGDRVAGYELPLSALVEGVPTTFTLVASNALGPATWSVETVLDTIAPEIDVPTPPAQIAAGEMVPLDGTWRDAGGKPAITIDGAPVRDVGVNPDKVSGKWSVRVPGITAGRELQVVATDRAGNTRTLQVPLVVAAPKPPVVTPPTGPVGTTPAAPPATVAAIQFPGFTNGAGTPVNKAGYPKVIVADETGIELVAVPFTDTKPTLYVGRRPVTTRQYEGDGEDTVLSGVRGKELQQWLLDHPPFDLLRAEEWDTLCATNVDLEGRTGAPYEWLRPVKWTDDVYPIRKEPDKKELSSKTSSSMGFRVCYRPK